MSDSRDTVLAAIRGAGLPPLEQPPVWNSRAAEPGELSQVFSSALEAAGGSTRFVTAEALADELAEHAEHLGAASVHSTHSALPSRHAVPFPRDPHDLAQLDLAVVSGGPAVAESGAVWVTPSSELDRAACFLAEHVALVVEARQLVGDLHQAYDHIDPAATAFGCFMAGPSKTADIEQVLVIGAHGARSLTVFVVG